MKTDIKDPIELLKIDFSKYASVAINGVYLKGLEVIAEDHPIQINISGSIDGNLIMATSFDKLNKVKIVELNRGYISLREINRW